MKQYERVTGMEKVMDHNGSHWHAQNYSNCIVLTIEEANKIWDAGWRAKALENNSDAKWTDFKSWMEYKGIKI